MLKLHPGLVGSTATMQQAFRCPARREVLASAVSLLIVKGVLEAMG
jgi:hypothetical protein